MQVSVKVKQSLSRAREYILEVNEKRIIDHLRLKQASLDKRKNKPR